VNLSDCIQVLCFTQNSQSTPITNATESNVQHSCALIASASVQQLVFHPIYSVMWTVL